MNCPKCPSYMVESTDESTMSTRIYRCAGCHTRFKFATANGRLVEAAKVTGAWGLLISIMFAVFGLGGWN